MPKRFFTFILSVTVLLVLSIEARAVNPPVEPLHPAPDIVNKAVVATTGADIVSGNLPAVQTSEANDWPMVAANPQRTSWTAEEVTGHLTVEWYRPIEAYIPQNSQIIASNGLLYVSTARGLYALDAANGDLVWHYDTELPLGNSPTVADNNVLYVGGYDRKLHALDASDGTHLWAFSGAEAGYDTNPLVIDGKVIAGNRDGTMYAIGAHGTASQGALVWAYETGGPIHLSAAYKDGVVYFAANDNYAYALNVDTGALIWKSAKLPGEQFQSYWPVIYRDKVIFSTAFGYRTSLRPGTQSIIDNNGTRFQNYKQMQLQDIFPNQIEGTTLGPEVAPQNWAHGFPLVDASRVTEYLEDNPSSDSHQHKPWRRALAVLNLNDGTEYTFDSDQDGHQEHIPVVWWGTNSGNRYPPIVGEDDILYQSNLWQCCSDAKGRIMGWNPDTPSYLSITEGFSAVAEPQAISAGGNVIYRNLCCDRDGDWFRLDSSTRPGELWSYDLFSRAPGYDQMWTVLPGWPRLHGWYTGNTNTINAAYHNHGDQNPIIPYQGRLYVHRSNAIVAFGPGSGPGQRPLLTVNEVQDDVSAISRSELVDRLEEEIEKIIAAGHLRPGYYNPGQFIVNYRWFGDYFDNPGETLHTLSLAYPHLSSPLQAQLRTYLRQEFQDYFDPNMYATTGWAGGAAREAMELPPEVAADLADNGPRNTPINFSWVYPPHNFYALWKYATVIPEDTARAYDLAKSKLQAPVPAVATAEYFRESPYELNAYIAGYIGFLALQDLAGMSGVDSQLRTQVQNELTRLLQLRVSIFTKDSYWSGEDRFHKKHLDIARNFMYLTPELGDYLYTNIPNQVQEAVDEYEYIAPYWFVSRYEAVIGEGVMANLYNYQALFHAKALILKEPTAELTKYLDVPAFVVGDLFYIQNILTLLGNSGAILSVTPTIQSVESGGSVTYTINVQHTGAFSSTVTLMATSNDPYLDVQLTPTSIDYPGGSATLTLTDMHDSSFTSPHQYVVPISLDGGDLTRTTNVSLLVNGLKSYLPLIVK